MAVTVILDVDGTLIDTNYQHAIAWHRALRAFGDGLVSLLLPAYLAALGLGPFKIGLIATATLAGSSVLTLFVGLLAPGIAPHPGAARIEKRPALEPVQTVHPLA